MFISFYYTAFSTYLLSNDLKKVEADLPPELSFHKSEVKTECRNSLYGPQYSFRRASNYVGQ